MAPSLLILDFFHPIAEQESWETILDHSIAARIALGAVLIGLVSSPARAVEALQLFTKQGNKSVMVRDYDAKVAKLANEPIDGGYLIEFSNGKTFRVGKSIGSGRTTLVLELLDEPDKVLRIPIGSGNFLGQAPFTGYINRTIDGSQMLDRLGIPKVKIWNYRRSEYAQVGRYSPDSISLRDLIYERPQRIGAFNFDQVLDRLDSFFVKTAAFSVIGDLKKDNLIFDPKRGEWLISDWTSGHVLFIGDGEIPKSFGRKFGVADLLCEPLVGMSGTDQERLILETPGYDWLLSRLEHWRSLVFQERARLEAAGEMNWSDQDRWRYAEKNFWRFLPKPKRCNYLLK